MPTLEASDIVSFLAMLVSLAAVIIGPIVTLKIAKRQSEYLSECEKLMILGEDEG